ncbi:MAG: glucose 1-dehydrogenase [Deltaproteobacteria bacterium]|nr:MAG: glucose 1-dehydrogenase [Deltaproteobacteria bacterium]
MKLKDKIAIVTGAGSGIGRAISLDFAEEGAKVLVNDVNQTGGEETVKIIKEMGGEASFFLADVSRSEEVQKMIATAMERYGKVDILVNNAAINTMGDSQATTEEDWNRTIAVNLTGPFLCAKYAIAEMKESGGGVIINISSVEGLSGFSNQLAYSSSKGGMINLTKCLAIDHARDNIRVNSICPANVETPMSSNLVDQEGMEPVKKYLLRKHALRRFGKPEEMAKIATFLASEDSSFITGTHIVADGGWLCGTSMDIAEIFGG